jgi:hypothetical protein
MSCTMNFKFIFLRILGQLHIIKKILMSIADLSFRAKLTFYLFSGVLNLLACGSLEKATFYTFTLENTTTKCRVN